MPDPRRPGQWPRAPRRLSLKRLGKPDPKDVIVVDDTPYDVEAAGKAGLRTIGLLCRRVP